VEEEPKEEAPTIKREESTVLELAFQGKTFLFEGKNLGWYDPEKLMGKYVAGEVDKSKPNVTRIVTDFGELDLSLLKAAIVKVSIDGVAVTLSPEALKDLPPQIKDAVIQKFAPTMKKEKEKLKNFERL
jgi:hypothetical protein